MVNEIATAMHRYLEFRSLDPEVHRATVDSHCGWGTGIDSEHGEEFSGRWVILLEDIEKF